MVWYLPSWREHFSTMENHFIVRVIFGDQKSIIKQQQQHFIISLSSTVGSIQQKPAEYCGWRCKDMCRHQDDSVNSSPESTAKEQNPAVFTKEEHEPHGLVQGNGLDLVLIVGRSSSKFSLPPRTTLSRDVGDSLTIPRAVWMIVRHTGQLRLCFTQLISRIGTIKCYLY